MNKHLNWLFRILFLLNIGAIFFLTFQSRADTLAMSKQVRDITAQTVAGSAEAASAAWWYNLKNFRQLAHLPEYFALGCTGLLAVRTFRAADMPFGRRRRGGAPAEYSRAGRLLLHCVYAWVCCLGVSCLDQACKHFLPTREFSLGDMGFDLLGYTCGILAVCGGLKLWEIWAAHKMRKGNYS
ncbi:MAG: VanZ family protein [Lachnospiraceae bacterium]|nr:VanZ family protein [Lachnospiraceae bacterium]